MTTRHHVSALRRRHERRTTGSAGGAGSTGARGEVFWDVHPDDLNADLACEQHGGELLIDCDDAEWALAVVRVEFDVGGVEATPTGVRVPVSGRTEAARVNATLVAAGIAVWRLERYGARSKSAYLPSPHAWSVAMAVPPQDFGVALSVFVTDPEGNQCEIYWATGRPPADPRPLDPAALAGEDEVRPHVP